MYNLIKRTFFTCVIVLMAAAEIFAQNGQSKKEKEAEYLQVVKKRSDKIVATLGITDSAKYYKVRDIIAFQYRDLNNIHDSREAKIKSLKAKEADDKKATDKEIEKLESEANKKLSKLHEQYLAKLGKELTTGQIEKVKDGMTYGVLPLTYNGYQDMLPTLTSEQKKQILSYLTEAREHAMDAGSSEKKHAWFGKYKGKINNYLSAAGINMKQASLDWQKRLKEEKAVSKGK